MRRSLHIDLALYGVGAAFAGYTALWSTLPAHRFWGAVAFGGYLPAAVLALMALTWLTVPLATRAMLAAGTAVAVTGLPLLLAAVQRAGGNPDRAQEEVIVVEESGVRLLDYGTPYLDEDAIAVLSQPLLGYNPYQPGMAVFGLPRALFGAHWFTDARIYFGLVTVAVLWLALRQCARLGTGRGVLLRAFQAVAVLPICALTLATGGDDLPVAALSVLAITCAAARRFRAAGLAIGVAAALKLFAWPVLVVLLLLAARRSRAMRFAVPAIGIPMLTLLPVLLRDFDAFVTNVVEFPLGRGVVTSPAESPLPGFLLAEHVPGGDVIATCLLAAAAVAIGVWLLRHPPGDAARVTLICAVGLSVALLLMPASRFGYLLYPAVFAAWWLPLRDAEPDESTVVEFWR